MTKIQTRRLWGVVLCLFALVTFAMSWPTHINISAIAVFIPGLLIVLLPDSAWDRYVSVQQRNEAREQRIFAENPSIKAREVWAKRFLIVGIILSMAWTYISLMLMPQIGLFWIWVGIIVPNIPTFSFLIFSDIKKYRAIRDEKRND
ncbi:MAG TPA: hypothetical protein VGH02_03535 [Rhizomicrobium sp.]|jgi:hypothetical protein